MGAREARGESAALRIRPATAAPAAESIAANTVLAATRAIWPQVVVVYPNNDPGAGGIIRHWQSLRDDIRFIIRRDIPRPIFLGLLRDAAILVGNSSSGIIEAASFRTPVIDIGPRQLGRERCKDVRNVPYRQSSIASAVRQVWNAGRPSRGKCPNIYGSGNAGARIAQTLALARIDYRLLRKIISY